jgi:hypothetical protein
MEKFNVVRFEQGRCQLKEATVAFTLFGFGRVKQGSIALHGLTRITAVKQNLYTNNT